MGIESKNIQYQKGFKYQLTRSVYLQTDIKGCACHWKWLSLDNKGLLRIESGYAWDGASGPTIDTSSSMRGSVGHDALYQLMRKGLLPQSCRLYADDLLKKWCVEDGMWKIRAELWRESVGYFATKAALPENQRKVYTAP